MTKTPIDRKQDVLRELDEPGYFTRARERAKRRKSPWNLLLIPLGLGAMGASWYGFLWLLVVALNAAMSRHPTTVGELMRSDCKGIGPVVFFVSPFFAAIPVGLLLGNCIVWCIPPARRVFVNEAKGVWHASFADAQRDLLLVARYVVPAALLLAFGGGILLVRCACR